MNLVVACPISFQFSWSNLADSTQGKVALRLKPFDSHSVTPDVAATVEMRPHEIAQGFTKIFRGLIRGHLCAGCGCIATDLACLFCCISYFMMVVLLLLHNRPAWAVGWCSDVIDGLGNSLWLCSSASCPWSCLLPWSWLQDRLAGEQVCFPVSLFCGSSPMISQGSVPLGNRCSTKVTAGW